VPRRRPGKIFGALIEEVRFAADSLLEGRRFEPSVPGPLIRETRVSTLQPHALLHARAVGISQLAVVNIGGSSRLGIPPYRVDALQL
jgi:hypothetical protein